MSQESIVPNKASPLWQQSIGLNRKRTGGKRGDREAEVPGCGGITENVLPIKSLPHAARGYVTAVYTSLRVLCTMTRSLATKHAQFDLPGMTLREVPPINPGHREGWRWAAGENHYKNVELVRDTHNVTAGYKLRSRPQAKGGEPVKRRSPANVDRYDLARAEEARGPCSSAKLKRRDSAATAAMRRKTSPPHTPQISVIRGTLF